MGPARAQEAPSATPAPIASPTLMDQQYDGRTHIMLAPYVWGATLRGVFGFSVPPLRRRPGGPKVLSVTVTPQQYAGNINSAAMFAFDARKGDLDLFGDVIYLNVSASGTAFSTISLGRNDRIQIPASFSTDARLSAAIWEVAGGFTFAHGHDADLSGFLGLRQFPVNLNLSYNATVGRRGLIAPSGTITLSQYTSDVVFGLRGKAFFGNDHWFVPYYGDVGSGVSFANQTWEAYSGVGYAFNHGQTLLAAWRALNYTSFPTDQKVQKLSLYGPLLGYTFNI